MHLRFICLLIASNLCVSHLFSQFPTEDHNADNPTFLDSTIADYDVFLTAEAHWDKNNIVGKRRMIEYLASRKSIDVIVVERSYDYGYWVNYFLEKGDSLFLKEFLKLDNFFSTYNGVVYDDMYRFYCWLREYNLANNLSIRIIGIDVRGLWEEKPRLWSFLKFIDRNPSLQEPLNKSIELAQHFMKKKNVSSKRIVNWVEELNESVSTLNIEDKDFLNYIINLKQSIPWTLMRIGDVKEVKTYREEQIAENFKKYIDHGQKVYGQYGTSHVALVRPDMLSWDPFATILDDDPFYKGKILSIGLIHLGNKTNLPRFGGEVVGVDLFRPFLTPEDLDRLKPEFLKLPPFTFVDLRATKERAKDYTQLLLIEFD